MANDRLFFLCRGCGATKGFYKYYPKVFGEVPDTFVGRLAGGYCTRTGWELTSWLNEHVMCQFRNQNHKDILVLPEESITILNEQQYADLRREQKEVPDGE